MAVMMTLMENLVMTFVTCIRMAEMITPTLPRVSARM